MCYTNKIDLTTFSRLQNSPVLHFSIASVLLCPVVSTECRPCTSNNHPLLSNGPLSDQSLVPIFFSTYLELAPFIYLRSIIHRNFSWLECFHLYPYVSISTLMRAKEYISTANLYDWLKFICAADEHPSCFYGF